MRKGFLNLALDISSPSRVVTCNTVNHSFCGPSARLTTQESGAEVTVASFSESEKDAVDSVLVSACVSTLVHIHTRRVIR